MGCVDERCNGVDLPPGVLLAQTSLRIECRPIEVNHSLSGPAGIENRVSVRHGDRERLPGVVGAQRYVMVDELAPLPSDVTCP